MMRFPRTPGFKVLELLRVAGVAAAALWLGHPYWMSRMIGTGDAVWYHNLLADVVVQFRAGEFPVYVGQSEFQFNGAVYPHRVAPYHQYLAGLLDLLTGHRLSFLTLQHVTIIVSFLGGALASYYVLSRLAPRHRTACALLAVLYVFCPGVAGLAYVQDLLMSVMTLPWVPLALGGAWLTFRENSWRALLLAALGLAMLWWCHPPIALWVTIAVALQQLLRLSLAGRQSWPLIRRGTPVSALLIGGIAYPVVSAYLLRAPGESVVPYAMDRALLLRQIAEAFPACIRPLDLDAAGLSQLQLGYGLMLVLLKLVLGAAWERRLDVALAAFVALGLFSLLLPLGGWTTGIWKMLPEALVGLTLYWPMQRLYIVIAGLIVVGAAALLPALPHSRAWRVTVLSTLVIAVAWSAFEMRSFHRRAHDSAARDSAPKRWQHTENATPMRHAYHLFAHQPPTMSHGVMDPEQESVLVDPSTEEALPESESREPWRDFVGSPDANPGILNLTPSFVLHPGRHYRLEFAFTHPTVHGVLQITGPEFFREYVLPNSGNELAFGAGPKANRTLSLWTSAAAPVEVKLRFIPVASDLTPHAGLLFARFRWREFDRAHAPVTVEGLIPYRARVRAATTAVLRTPRMAVPGYMAKVNGTPAPALTLRSGLVGVAVPAGESTVEVTFVGVSRLRVAFWLSLFSCVVLLIATIVTQLPRPGCSSAD